jgi:deoxyadenosine/deoxycytidine kinase
MVPNLKHIAIAGNIGAGKTTLTTKLANHFNWDVHYEDTENNPYLSDFYNDMLRWSFNLQVYFLNSRYRQVLNIQQGNRIVIQDRSIYEDAHIFAPNLHDMNLMSHRDFDNYFQLFQLMQTHVKPPDLMIYLRANISTLVSHIQQRGRDYENSISIDYLNRLNDRYETWINQYTDGRLLIIPIDNMDFENNPADFGLILNEVEAQLHGLF